MHYVVTAYDFTDPEALSRRLDNREAHLAGVRNMLEDGTFLSGGAMLDDEGRMIGSSALRYPRRAERVDQACPLYRWRRVGRD